MRFYGLISISILFILLPFSACDSLHVGSISEGHIIFDITYPETDAGDLMASLLPKEMVLKFKNNKTIGELNAGMGVFKTSLLADPIEREVMQLVKVMNKKYVLKIDSNEIHKLIRELPPFKLHYVDETKMIAGYKCKKAIVKFIDNIRDEFSIYYTDDIGIENSNWFNPFYEIKGVLLEYQVKKYNYVMRLSASKVLKTEVNDTDYLIPEGYKEISQNEMDDIFSGFKEI